MQALPPQTGQRFYQCLANQLVNESATHLTPALVRFSQMRPFGLFHRTKDGVRFAAFQCFKQTHSE